MRWPSLQSSKTTFSQPFKDKCISDILRIGSIIIFHLSKLWKANFFILCGVIFLVRLQRKFGIDHSWEWKGSVKWQSTEGCSRIYCKKSNLLVGCASLLPVVIIIITVAFSTFPCQKHRRPKNLPLISEQTRGPVYERPWLRFEYERRLKIAGRILAMFTLGARALVPGHRNKMVLCSHIGYPRYKHSLYCPSTRSLKIWRSVQISAQR